MGAGPVADAEGEELATPGEVAIPVGQPGPAASWSLAAIAAVEAEVLSPVGLALRGRATVRVPPEGVSAA